MDLIGLVHQQVVACLAGKQVNLQVICDNFTLNARAAKALGKVLHKLATSATKHGALSCTEGKVLIVFDEVEKLGEPVELRMQWMESSGPSLKPHLVSGIRSGALARMICQETNGRLTMEYPHQGLFCVVNMALEHNSTQSSTQAAQTLTKVLVYEENALIALDLMDHLIADGFEVVGPTACAREAIQLMQSIKADFALVDIESHSDAAWRLTNELAASGIPFAYTHKQLGTEGLPAQYLKASILKKPFKIEQVRAITNELSYRANGQLINTDDVDG